MEKKTSPSLAASCSNLFGALSKANPVMSLISARSCPRSPAFWRIEPCAHGCSTDGELGNDAIMQRAFYPRLAAHELRGVAGEFLSQRQRCRVLCVGAPDLDDIVPGFSFCL